MTLLRITLLGTPTVSIGENPVFQENHTKAQALLYYLVSTGRTHYRSELASLFWPDVPDVQALKNLRNILPVLRSRVDAHILVTRHTVTFNRDAPYWLDVEAFEALLRIDPAQISTAALWEAVALYDDDFLSGFYVRNAPLFEEWMLLKRERLRDMFLDVLQTLAHRHLQQRDYHMALDATRRLLNIAPWHENGHQQQMQALLGLGQRSTALAQYQICCRILAAEFNITPSDETQRIHEQIKAISPHTPAHTPANDAPPRRGKAASLPLAMSTDGKLLALPDSQDTIRLENLITNRCLHWLSGHSAPVTALSFSPNGRTLASASDDQTVRLWDVVSGTSHSTLIGHSAPVTALSFSPDGYILASAGTDQTVRLWDTSSGMQLAAFQDHQHPVAHVAFVPDGSCLVSVDTCGVVMSWSVLPRRSIQLQTLSLSE